MKPPPDPCTGHRRRLRGRMLDNGIDSLLDYETVELLLTFAIPRRDTKPIAKELLNRFGTLENIVDASPTELAAVPGLGQAGITLINFIKQFCARYLKEKASRISYKADSPQEIVNFLRMKIGAMRKESMIVIYLDARNHLIGYRVFSGTVNYAAVYIREIVEDALLRHAVSVIAAHNHPSGICEPSGEDIKLIRQLSDALSLIGVKLADHLLITASASFSFAEKKFL